MAAKMPTLAKETTAQHSTAATTRKATFLAFLPSRCFLSLGWTGVYAGTLLCWPFQV